MGVQTLFTRTKRFCHLMYSNGYLYRKIGYNVYLYRTIVSLTVQAVIPV